MQAWRAIESGTEAALVGVAVDDARGRMWTIAREPAAVRMRGADGSWIEWGFDAWREPLAIARGESTIVVATAGGMLVAADGAEFRRLERSATAVVADNAGVLFALSDGVVCESHDHGETFRAAFAADGAIAIAACNGEAFALTPERLVTKRASLALPAGDHAVVGAGVGLLVVAGSHEGRARALVSRDGGASYAVRDLGLIGEPTAIAVDGSDDAIIVGRRGLARSTSDGGETFVREKLVTSADLSGVTIAGGRVIVVGDAGVIVARDL